MLLDLNTQDWVREFAMRFSSALTDPEEITPCDIIGPRGKAAHKRYNVYRNNVTVSLIDALAAVYPAVQRIVEATSFEEWLVFTFGRHHQHRPFYSSTAETFLPSSRDLNIPQDLPWLADVARIERAWLDAYHAADSMPLSIDKLGEVPSDRLGDIIFTPHPAMQIVESPTLRSRSLLPIEATIP